MSTFDVSVDRWLAEEGHRCGGPARDTRLDKCKVHERIELNAFLRKIFFKDLHSLEKMLPAWMKDQSTDELLSDNLLKEKFRQRNPQFNWEPWNEKCKISKTYSTINDEEVRNTIDDYIHRFPEIVESHRLNEVKKRFDGLLEKLTSQLDYKKHHQDDDKTVLVGHDPSSVLIYHTGKNQVFSLAPVDASTIKPVIIELIQHEREQPESVYDSLEEARKAIYSKLHHNFHKKRVVAKAQRKIKRMYRKVESKYKSRILFEEQAMLNLMLEAASDCFKVVHLKSFFTDLGKMRELKLSYPFRQFAYNLY